MNNKTPKIKFPQWSPLTWIVIILLGLIVFFAIIVPVLAWLFHNIVEPAMFLMQQICLPLSCVGLFVAGGAWAAWAYSKFSKSQPPAPPAENSKN